MRDYEDNNEFNNKEKQELRTIIQESKTGKNIDFFDSMSDMILDLKN